MSMKKLSPNQLDLLSSLERKDLYSPADRSPLRASGMRSLNLLIYAKLVKRELKDFGGEMVAGMYRNRSNVYSITSLGLEVLRSPDAKYSQEESVFARALAVKTSPRKTSAILARIQEARRVEVDTRYASDIEKFEEILGDFEDARNAVLALLNKVKIRGEAGKLLFDAMTNGDGGDDSFFDVVNAAMYGDVGPETVSIQDAIEALDEGEPE